MLVLAIDTALSACAAAVLDTRRAAMIASETLPLTRGHAEVTNFASGKLQVHTASVQVPDARVDLLLTRHDEGDVGVNVLRREGALDVVVLK